ncbi:hypothetical protein A3A60_00430 [Candidatus Curtissbacteria bacterium RIFCSPLOWO2_01_FULL_42_26]|uniref:PAS domain-containing protein n=1 Tax=Candidatus Curtissbacteria bacterium RIFCSPLOWO2_01_FULL_42_26 TaxID=1797729 RepID=A0A1F5I1J6_9BACT|nr:MAG: hypothetical protein A3A60_00430 [Candidatus Curtissbacteria bacterium RIFCSPLOWO2_01_FULL_42_26]
MSYLKLSASLAYFLILGFGAILILHKAISLTTIMQIFSILAILIIASSKFVLPHIKNPAKTIVIFVALAPAVFLINLLILTTNLIFSPFIILTHFFAIGTAFLISPQIAVTYIASTLIILVIQLATSQALVPLVSNSPLLALLYLISYAGLVPFLFILAKQYKFKEEWAQILEKQIATSQVQEEQLLRNIDEAVVVIDPTFSILYINQKARELFRFGSEVLRKDFYKVFSLKDTDGRDLYSYSLPFDEIIKSKLPQILKDLQIAGLDKKFIKVGLRIIPAITAEGPLGLILVIYDKTSKALEVKKQQNTIDAALSKFIFFLENQKNSIESLKTASDTARLLAQNERLTHLAEDFVYALRLQSGEIGSLSNLVDLGLVLQSVIDFQRKKAQTFSVILEIPTAQSQYRPIMPKTKITIATKHKIFPEVYVIGNEVWIKDSVERILELAFRVSVKKSIVILSLEVEGDLAKIVIKCFRTMVSEGQAAALFEEFSPQLSNLTQLSWTTGLEGYIARSLLARMGAHIFVESKESLNFTITFGLHSPATEQV